jgi:tetratricopeptide (TPR) repeat protein
LREIAQSLFSLKQFAEAASRFDEALTILWRFEADHPKAVNSTGQRANALNRLGRDEEALALLNQLVERVGLGWDYPPLPDLLPVALTTWLYSMERLDRMDEAYAAADALIEAFDPPNGQRRSAGRRSRAAAMPMLPAPFPYRSLTTPRSR